MNNKIIKRTNQHQITNFFSFLHMGWKHLNIVCKLDKINVLNITIYHWTTEGWH